MTDLTAVIHDLVRIFDRLGLPYAIMGGIAVRAHGIPRPTYDVDFTLAVPRDRLGELFEAIADRGYTVPEQYSRGWVDMVGGMPLVKVRLFLEGRSVDADMFIAETPFQGEVLDRRITADVEGLSVKLVSAEDLILFKLVAARPRDLLDIQDVLFTQGDLDEPYLRRWAGQLGVEAKLDDVLASRE
jgi:predicted nucleotidyltransferase